MAKFDEADPRWIVEIREDGHNLNQWHWTDRSLLGWSESKLNEIFPADLEFGRSPLYVFFFKKLEHVKGEVMLLMRKGKAIVSYQLDLKLNWVARSGADGEVIAEGAILMPYISDENDLDEFDIKITMSTAENNTTYDAKQKALELVRPHLRSAIPKFLTDLLKNHSSKHGAVVGSASPSAGFSQATPTPGASSSSPSPTPSSPSAGVSLARAGSSSLLSKTLKMDVEFTGPPAELFECFSDVRRVAMYAGSESKWNFAVGNEFALFDGNVVGKIVDIKPREMLSLSWRLKSWPADHFSLVTLSFTPCTVGCIISLVQESVPATEIEATRDGWNRFYWDRISACFGCSHKVK